MRASEFTQGHRPHLYLDMDGVQADFFTAWARLFGKEQYKEIGDRAAREASIADLNSRGPEFVEKFFATLPVLPGAQQLIAFLRDNNIQYTILSAPLRGNEDASIRGKLTWLNRHHPGTADSAIFTNEKQRYATANGKANVLVDDFKKYVNAWQADGGIAVLYRWNNASSAIEQLKKIYNINSDTVDEATVGTLYSPKILGTATVGSLVIPIHKHLYDQAASRNIEISAVEKTLRRLSKVSKKLKKVETGQKVWVFDPKTDISLGMLMLDSGALMLNTVIPGEPHAHGVTSVVRLYEFDPGEDGFGPFKLYVGDPYRSHLIGEFPSLGPAIQEVEIIIDTDPDSADNQIFTIKDGTGETVWERDPAVMYDQWRSGRKMQFKKPDDGVTENFADGKKPGRKGLAKRVGVNCKQSISKLRSIASNSSGERQRMAHWCAKMKSGRKK